MASVRQQKPCVACQNGVATCSGCQKRFCLTHFTEHRQELDKRMGEVVHEHNQLREALGSQDTVHPLLSRIEDWEKVSIQKIKNTVEQARADLQAFLDRTKHRLVDSLGSIADQLKSSQAATVYTENELDEWMKQLVELRQMFEKPQNIEIVEDESRSSSVRMIKVTEKSNSGTCHTINQAILQSRPSTAVVSTGT
ncbi:unnamed protein product [Rotaria socialis]|uniref:B box-type domain-containing protein n=1 Tax=Rotaria socialis TaxID=392032 RepID=A0A821UMP2_9BILA|nr:unnamed protein product [Rotaria socialis]CAF3395872.1 unnamed protein product [Rotaria socialis]CAF3453774.1 unnamed protein product [Rotaria socialis]CAF3610023.1 unnamed protein product [Rotaria socialis]CAF3728407.1 unnamed protein product [Rotaria socialis]